MLCATTFASDLRSRADLAKGRFGQGQARHDERFARANFRSGTRALRHSGQRRHVSTANVFGQRGPDDLANFFCRQGFHGGKMDENQGQQKPVVEVSEGTLDGATPPQWRRARLPQQARSSIASKPAAG